MRNRLTFPEGGLETKYVWDKYSLNNNGIYIWDKHYIDKIYTHFWDKYTTKAKEYRWNKYHYITTTYYNWERYPLVYTEDDYLIYKRPLEDTARSKYLNLTASVTKTIRTDYAYDKSRTKIYLFKTDNTVDEYSVADILNHDEMMATLLRYGYCGFNVLASSTMPAFFFTENTRLEKSADGTQIVFSELYGQYTNTTSKIKNLTDSPTGSYYIEYNMQWATDTVVDIQARAKTSGKPAPSSYKMGDYYYDFINDGFWNKAIGGNKIDTSNPTILTSTDANRYPVGINGDYSYEKISNTYEYEKGEFIEQVTNSNADTYPENGAQGNYWYELQPFGHYEWYKCSYKTKEYVYKTHDYNAVSVKSIKKLKKYRMTTGITITDIVGGYEYIGEEEMFAPYGSGQYILGLMNSYSDTTLNKYAVGYAHDRSSLDEGLFGWRDEFSALDGALYTQYNNTIGIYSIKYKTGPYDDREDYLYLFTPETTFTLDSEIPIFTKLKKYKLNQKNIGTLNWQYGNTVTDANTQMYLADYTLPIGDVIEDVDWDIGNPYLSSVKTMALGLDRFSWNAYQWNAYGDGYKDYSTGYYYRHDDFNTEVIYNGVMGKEYGDYYNVNFTEYKGEIYYPELTQHIGKCYVYTGRTIQGADEVLGKVTSYLSNTYPENGIQGDYWYQYIGFNQTQEDIIEIDEYVGIVESSNSSEYPDNGYKDTFWYIFKETKIDEYLGSYIGEVNDEMITAYPKDGVKQDFWYIYNRFENNGPYKSKWIGQVETNQSNAFPRDGINGYYWYVYNNSYEGYKYQINDEQIRGGIDYKHTINPEDDYTIGCVASAEIELDYDNRNNDIENYLDCSYCDYYTWQPNDEDWRLIGRFYLDNVNHNRKLVNIKAFDAIGIDGDTFMDAFIEATTFPISVRQFFTNICSTLGYECSIDSSLVNLDFQLQDNFEAINITARQLLQYVAEVCAGFVRVDKNNVINLRTYKTKDLDLSNSQYTKTSVANYTTEKVSSLTVRTTNDDLGVSAGNGDNKYIIENNPLFYAQSNVEIQKEVNNIYNKLREVSYVPADIELLQDFGIECGDIITLNGATFYVMEKEISASGCKLKCVGNKVRAQQESGINSDIVALRGKTNELYRDLEMTQSTLTDTANGLQSQITQTAEEISLRVTNEVAGLESKITQTADSITSTVTDQINQTKSEIKQTTDSISLQVDSQGELMAQLRLDVDGIALRGYVTFTDLAGSGTTVINGSNITTGTISADRINMTGAISWGDLDADCKDTIASYAGRDGDDADVPDYIHNTYIDATRIVSPTIQGGTLSAGTTADGYMKLSSTGLNFHSSEKPICGIGYYSGNKELPYIVLGAGVDDYGTDKGMIKKYTNGIWIGDGDGLEGNSPTGTGIFINFNTGAIQKYVNGSASAL